MFYQTTNLKLRQQGAAALFVVVVLLFITTLVTIYTSKVALQEIKISANDYRHRQAFHRAEFGLDRANAYIQADSGNISSTDMTVGWVGQGFWQTCNSDPSPCTNYIDAADYATNLIYQGVQNVLADVDAAQTPVIDLITEDVGGGIPAALPEIRIYASGTSDDSTASSQQTVRLASRALFGLSPPDVPLAAGGGLHISGSIDITPKVYLAEKGDLMDGAETSAITGGDATSGGSQVIDDSYDQNNAVYTDGIFEKLFQTSSTDLKQALQSGLVDGEVLSDCSSLNENSRGIKWITGSCTINSNGTVGWDPTGETDCDVNNQPLWIIVENSEGDTFDVTYNGTPTVWAITMVLSSNGQMKLLGTLDYHGSIFAEDNIDFGSGNFSIEPNDLLVNCPSDDNDQYYVKEQGSWFDDWV